MQKLLKEYKVFSILFVIQAKNWLASPMNIFLGVFITFYTVLCWLTFKDGDNFLMISGICVAMTRNSMYIYLRTLLDWKGKTFRDKLQMTNINGVTKQASLLAFNFVSTLIICLVLVIISVSFFPGQITWTANLPMLIFGLIMCWVTCCATAIAIYLIIPNAKWSLMFGLLIYFFSTYFLGLGFPFSTITDHQWLNILIYFHPIRYSINIVQAGYVGATDFKYVIDGNMIVDFKYAGQTWIPIVAAIGVITILIVIILLKINHERGYKFRSNNSVKIMKSKSKAYIKQIKETNDINLLREIREDRMGELKDEMLH
ncbi:ABC transporter permease [Entomoplasma ellychniae]|uniref:ABC transporter permease n=2 Tax=Entomoplasmataceae TaxID=33925 RepID=A0A2S5RGR1_9MOLU|nr:MULTISPECIES: hypothetical protein [Entomoplasmataceae]PPE04978.1 ABC transporter permease [Entomoplasma ellychniae]PPE06490.1 ABC transporter permease [Mesoplasma corruscae]